MNFTSDCIQWTLLGTALDEFYLGLVTYVQEKINPKSVPKQNSKKLSDAFLVQFWNCIKIMHFWSLLKRLWCTFDALSKLHQNCLKSALKLHKECMILLVQLQSFFWKKLKLLKAHTHKTSSYGIESVLRVSQYLLWCMSWSQSTANHKCI